MKQKYIGVIKCKLYILLSFKFFFFFLCVYEIIYNILRGFYSS